jgi:hypothetical protein
VVGRRLAEAARGVQAGRLVVVLMTWHVEEGYITFPTRPPGGAPPPSADGEPAGEPPPEDGR